VKVRKIIVSILVAIFVFSSAAALTQAVVLPSVKIQTYGSQANSFANLLPVSNNSVVSERSSLSSIVVISDTKNADLNTLNSTVKGASAAVFINLPVGNGLFEVPTLTENITTGYGYDNTTQSYVTGTSTIQAIYPAYWIAVVQNIQSIPSISYVLALNDSGLTATNIQTFSTEAVKDLIGENLSPASASATADNMVMKPLYNGYPESPWMTKSPTMSYIVYFGTKNLDWFYTYYVGSQLEAYDTVNNNAYWQMYSYIDHYLGGDYKCEQSQIGPYMYQQNTNIQWSGATESMVGPTSSSYDTTESYDIGVSFQDNGVGASGSASWSTTVPGVSLYVSGSPTSYENWQETYKGAVNNGLWETAPDPSCYGQDARSKSIIVYEAAHNSFSFSAHADWSMHTDNPTIYPLPGWQTTYSYTSMPTQYSGTMQSSY
jgi:hypothetical protein